MWSEIRGIAALFGQRIEAAAATEQSVWIRLASGNVLRIRSDESGPVCDALPSTDEWPTPQTQIGGGSVEVVFASGSVLWAGESLIKVLKGKDLVRIQKSANAVFLYASGLPTICFGAMRDCETGRVFLFWEESD